jgi:hypothetical protein
MRTCLTEKQIDNWVANNQTLTVFYYSEFAQFGSTSLVSEWGIGLPTIDQFTLKNKPLRQVINASITKERQENNIFNVPPEAQIRQSDIKKWLRRNRAKKVTFHKPSFRRVTRTNLVTQFKINAYTLKDYTYKGKPLITEILT